MRTHRHARLAGMVLVVVGLTVAGAQPADGGPRTSAACVGGKATNGALSGARFTCSGGGSHRAWVLCQVRPHAYYLVNGNTVSSGVTSAWCRVPPDQAVQWGVNDSP